MAVRFQADADLNQMILLAAIRREPAIDFQTAVTAGLAGLTDDDVLNVAARDSRILVTHDHRTMPRHFGTFITQQTSAGVIIVRQSLPIVEVVEDLLLIHSASDESEWVNRLIYLPL